MIADIHLVAALSSDPRAPLLPKFMGDDENQANTNLNNLPEDDFFAGMAGQQALIEAVGDLVTAIGNMNVGASHSGHASFLPQLYL